MPHNDANFGIGTLVCGIATLGNKASVHASDDV